MLAKPYPTKCRCSISLETTYPMPFSGVFFSAPLRSRDLARALNAPQGARGEKGNLGNSEPAPGGSRAFWYCTGRAWGGEGRLKVRFESLLRAREARDPRCREGGFPAHACPLAKDLLEKLPG